MFGTVFGLGPNTAWLLAHHILSIGLVLSIADYVLGSVFFSTQPSGHAALHMRIGSTSAVVLAVLVVISGIVHDIGFGNPALFNQTWGNLGSGFAITHQQTNGNSLGNIIGPLNFDVKQHVSLLIPGLAVMIAVLCWKFGKDIVKVQHYRRAVLTITSLSFAWIAVIAVIGIYLARFLTFPVGA